MASATQGAHFMRAARDKQSWLPLSNSEQYFPVPGGWRSDPLASVVIPRRGTRPHFCKGTVSVTIWDKTLCNAATCHNRTG
jgi:hypothetical protein